MALDLLPYLIGTGAQNASVSTTLTVNCGDGGGWPALPGDTIIFAGGSGAAQPTGASDSRGNTYTKLAGTASNPASSVWAAVAGANGLKAPGPGVTADSLTITYAGNGQAKQWIALGCQGLGAADLAATPATGTSNAPTITSGTPAVAGELFIALFLHANAAGATATDVAGWITIAKNVNLGANAYASAYARVNTGTSPVTFTGSIGSSQLWTAQLVSFRPSAAWGQLRSLVGSSTFKAAYPGLGYTDYQAKNAFDGFVGRQMSNRAAKRYLSEGQYETAANPAQSVVDYTIGHGIFCQVSIKATRAPGGGVAGDITKLAAMLTYWKNNGVAPHCVLWNEANGHGANGDFGNGSQSKTPTSPYTVASGDDAAAAANYIDYFNYYAPTICAAGLQAQWNPATYSPATCLTFMPARYAYGGSNAWLNGVSIDFYMTDSSATYPSGVNTAKELPPIITVCDAMTPPCPVGIGEMGFTNGTARPQNTNPSGVASWLDTEVTGKLSPRQAAGKQNLPVLWYANGTGNTIDGTTDAGIVAAIQRMYDGLTVTSTGGGGGPSITTLAPPPCEQARAFAWTMAAANGTAPYTWAKGAGAPAGLSLSSGGVWSGTPSTAGTYSFTVTATDAASAATTATITITVAAPVTVVTTTANLPHATAGVPASIGLQPGNGVGPYTWAVTAGSLSPFALSSAGTISGTNPTAGTVSFTVQVTDGAGATATAALVLTTDAAPADPGGGGSEPETIAADSLLLAGRFQLLGGEVSDDPACTGAIFRLGRAGGDLDYDLGMPQPQVDVLAALALDGERPVGRRASNRTMTIPLVILAPDRDTLAAAREALLSAIDADTFTLEWARAGQTTMVFDCFRAGAAIYAYSLLRDRQLISTLDVTFTALPYGRSADLETIAFPPPSASWPVPLNPVVLDDFSSVASVNDPAQWSRAGVAAGGGTGSAHWSRTVNDCPDYARTLVAAVDIGTRSRLSFWLGLSTTPDAYHLWHGGRVQVDFTLTDSGGTSVRMAATVNCKASGKPGVPEWNKVSVALPSSSLLDTSAIASYEVKAWNTTGGYLARPGVKGPRVLQADAWLSYLVSSPVVVGSPGIRGAAYDLRGILGSARTPLSLQVQPGSGVAQTIFTRTTSGTQNYTIPAGATTAWLEGWGAGGGGGSGSAGSVNDGGAGGGGGEYAAEPSWPVAPGSTVAVSVGAAGSGGPSPGGAGGAAGSGGGDTTLSIGGVVIVRAHGGDGGVRGALTNTTGGKGGSGSNASVHYDGGTGARPQGGWGQRFEGSGGGSSGGQGQPGNDGQVAYRANPPSGTTFLPGAGGSAVAGGGPGGKGGDAAAGHTPSRGPGGGGGGGDGSGSGFAGGAGATGKASVITVTPATFPLQTLVLHRPGPNAPPAFQPLVDVGSGGDTPNGTIEYPVASQVPGVPAKFGGGTHTVILVASAWHGTAARLVTVAVSQYDGVSQPGSSPDPGGRASVVSVSRTLAPADAPNGLVVVGDLPLPPRGLAGDQAGVTFTVTVKSGDASDRFNDVLLLDTEGSTVLVDTITDGWSNVWLDAPEPGLGLGLVLGSTGDRDSASSILDDTVVSGPPLFAEPGDQWMLAYSPSGAPALFASYTPRWFIDRLR